MKIISKNEYNSRFPKNDVFDIEDMDLETQCIFFNIYSMYRKLFTDYVVELLGLKKYDNEILNSSLNFISISESQMDFYQNFSKEQLNFLYIRNNIYIERLSSSDREVLYNKFLKKDYELDEISRELIGRTYKKVIFEDVQKNGEICMTNYGPNGSLNYFAQNNSLIIGLRYDEMNLNGLDENEWLILYRKQSLYINELIDKMIKEFNGRNIGPINVIKYDDYSVKKNDTLELSEIKK